MTFQVLDDALHALHALYALTAFNAFDAFNALISDALLNWRHSRSLQ